MTRNAKWLVTKGSPLLLGLGGSSTPGFADTSPDQWRFDALVYAYLPQLSGSVTFPTGTTANINVDPHELISSLNFALMGAFEARSGPWSVFTDLIYVNASGSKSATRSLFIPGISIPATVTAYAHLSIKTTVWTLGGSYRVVDLPEASLDLVAGTRALFLRQHLNWQFSADVGPFVGPGRQGSGDSNPTNWDGVIGFKGQWMFGDQHEWFVPYYFDVGTGGSQLTWQGIAGVGYKFSWGEVVAAWRYLDYQFSNHSSTLAMNGPAIGVGFRW
jgi:hypothetical protein